MLIAVCALVPLLAIFVLTLVLLARWELTVWVIMSVTLLSLLLLCGGGILAVSLVHEINATAERAAELITLAYGKEETAALDKISSGGLKKTMLWFLEKVTYERSFTDQHRAVNSMAETALVHTRDIVFAKLPSTDEFVLHIPPSWKKMFKNLPLPERCRLYSYFDIASAETLAELFTAAEAKPRRLIRQKAMLKVSPRTFVQVLIIASSAPDVSGGLIVTGTIAEAGHRNQAEILLGESRSLCEFLSESSADFVYEADITADYYRVITTHRKSITGLFSDNGSFVEQQKKFDSILHPDYKKGFDERFIPYEKLLTSPNLTGTYECRIKVDDGQYIWIEHTIKVLSSDDGGVKRIAGRIVDINKHKYHDLFATEKARRDELTGLLVFPEFKKFYEERTAIGDNIVLIHVAIGNLRGIITKYGGEIADMAIKYAADNLKSFGDKGITAWRDRRGAGGDFVGFITGGDHNVEEQTLWLAEELEKIYSEPVKLGKYPVSIEAEITTGLNLEDYLASR